MKKKLIPCKETLTWDLNPVDFIPQAILSGPLIYNLTYFFLNGLEVTRYTSTYIEADIFGDVIWPGEPGRGQNSSMMSGVWATRS